MLRQCAPNSLKKFMLRQCAPEKPSSETSNQVLVRDYFASTQYGGNCIACITRMECISSQVSFVKGVTHESSVETFFVHMHEKVQKRAGMAWPGRSQPSEPIGHLTCRT